MQEFWMTATVHHHAIRFKMDNKNHIVNLESFRDMLHICLRVHGQYFVEPPFEEEILPSFVFLDTVQDDNMFSTIKLVSKHQNTQQFGALLPIELTNEEIRNLNAYNKYYTVATGAAPPKPKASVQKTRSSFDTTITPPTAAAAMIEAQQLKLVTKRSLQQTHISQASGSGENEETGSIPGVPDVPTDEFEEELSWNSTDKEGDDNEGKDGDGDEEDDGDDGEKGDGDDDDEDDDGEEGDDDDDQEVVRDDEQEYDEEEYDEEIRDEESFDHIPKTPENSDDEGNGKGDLGLNVGREEGHDEEEEEDEIYKAVHINQGMGIQATLEVEGSHVTLTPVNLDVALLPMTEPTMTPFTIATTTTTSQATIPHTTASSSFIQDLHNFGSLFGFDNRLGTLEANLSEFMQTNQFGGAVSVILEIVHRYIDQRMNEAVQVAVQLQSDKLCVEAQIENDEFLKTIDANMQKIIKEQVKEQVNVQVSKILPRIEQTMNKQLEAEVLTRSSHSSKTSYDVAADLSEIELKKILIEKIEGNKSIQRSNKQRNLYKAPVEAYESDKIILDTYAGPDRGSKRRREGKEPESVSAPTETATRSAGMSTQGSQSRQTSASESAFVEEPMQTTFQIEEPSHPEFDTGAEDQPIVQSSHHPEWFSQKQKPPSSDRDWNKTVPATQGSIQPWISKLAKLSGSRSSFNELMDTPLDFSNFLINRLKVDTLTPKLLVGPTYELMKGSCKSLQYPHNLLKPLSLIPNNRGRRVIPFEHFINNDLEYLRRVALSRKYTTSITKTKAADYGHIKWIEDLVPKTMWIEEPICYDKHALWEVSHWGRKRQQFCGFAVNWESARDVYSKRRIIAVTELKIVEWHNYKHLDWIMVRRDNDKHYKFKEGDFKRLRIQDIEDMLLLLVQGKLTNLTVEELFAFNKKLNLTKPDSYRSDLKRKEAYTAYFNPRGFIYQNKDKKNRLMRIDELHKFSDGTLTDVRTALDDRLKGIQMQYLP
nr:hypothetical protein [Tanacetum cinerariifolium]